MILNIISNITDLLKKGTNLLAKWSKERKERRIRDYNKAVSNGNVARIKSILRKWL